MDSEKPKKLAKGVAAGIGGVGVSGLLFFQLQTISNRVERMDAKLGVMAEHVAALRVKVFGQASVTQGPPAPLATPFPHSAAKWAEPMFPIPMKGAPKK